MALEGFSLLCTTVEVLFDFLNAVSISILVIRFIMYDLNILNNEGNRMALYLKRIRKIYSKMIFFLEICMIFKL